MIDVKRRQRIRAGVRVAIVVLFASAAGPGGALRASPAASGCDRTAGVLRRRLSARRPSQRPVPGGRQRIAGGWRARHPAGLQCRRGQQVTFDPAEEGYYRITVRHSGKVLDVLDASLEDFAPVVQNTPNGGASQQWSVEPVGDGYYRLLARHSGKALNVTGASPVNGALVIQYTSVGAMNEQWLLRSLTTAPQPTSADVVRFLEQATWGPTPTLIEHVQAVGFESYLDEQFAAPISSYPTLPLYPTTRDTVACPNGIRLPAGQLHDVPAAEPLLRQCAVRRGSAAAARRVGAAPDHRGLRRRHHAAKLDGAVPPDARPQRVRQLPPAALRDHAQPGDGQLPGRRRATRRRTRTRTTRARSCSSSRSARSG